MPQVHGHSFWLELAKDASVVRGRHLRAHCIRNWVEHIAWHYQYSLVLDCYSSSGSTLKIAHDSLCHEAGTACADHIQLLLCLTLLSHLLGLLWLHHTEYLDQLVRLSCLLRHVFPLSGHALAKLLDEMLSCTATCLSKQDAIIDFEGGSVADPADEANSAGIIGRLDCLEDISLASHVNIGVEATVLVQKFEPEEVSTQGRVQVFVDDDIPINQEIE